MVALSCLLCSALFLSALLCSAVLLLSSLASLLFSSFLFEDVLWEFGVFLRERKNTIGHETRIRLWVVSSYLKHEWMHCQVFVLASSISPLTVISFSILNIRFRKWNSSPIGLGVTVYHRTGRETVFRRIPFSDVFPPFSEKKTICHRYWAFERYVSRSIFQIDSRWKQLSEQSKGWNRPLFVS